MAEFQIGQNYIENLETGALTWLREENGVYLMDIWLPPVGPGFHRKRA